VRSVIEGSGASVHYLDHELQRISRDVQMMGAHTVFDLDLVAEQCGRALLEAGAPLFPHST
jgi:3-hydroxy-9,10-secoandrosta-1,3,5(10)-triene-9,17-dione monooxygenase